MIAVWDAVLVELERQLDTREFDDVPTGLGVLPDELRGRGAALHARMRDLEATLQMELEHTRQLLALEGGAAPREPGIPVLFDRHA